MASRYNLPHISIDRFRSENSYQGEGTNIYKIDRIREDHARRIQSELTTAFAQADRERPADDRLPEVEGVYLEVELRGKTPTDILDLSKSHIRSGASKNTENNNRTIAVYVPDYARHVLEKILEDYRTGPLGKSGDPPQKDRVESIEAVRMARLETFWTDNIDALPKQAQDEIWWGLWCHKKYEASVEGICARLALRVASKDRRLFFPEITVVPVLATRAAVELLLFATEGIAELRRASDTPFFFTDTVKGEEHPWVDHLAERVTWPGNDAPAVCLFDTGVNRGHPLIEPALSPDDTRAVDMEWGGDDHHVTGHGTGMAGLILHGDLTASLGDASERVLRHRLESVKLLPPGGFPPTDPKSYGTVTQAAVAVPEIQAPDRKRVFCMAVTNENVSGATPSTWSSAVDQAAAGNMIADEAENDERRAKGLAPLERPRRLIVVSGGNIPPEMDPTRLADQDDCPIEDPAQAWNALTIGGYTDLIDIRDKGYEDWTPSARAGELSPHSRTSNHWTQGVAPIKPELVMEAGNRALNPAKTEIVTLGSLSLLTTGKEAAAPLVPFEATSAATAQAARIAAQLQAAHPEYWPETIRALMIHSGEWTAPMWEDIESTQSKRIRYKMVRRFGYGVPSFERALGSATNHLALLAQAEIQPFKNAQGRKFNHCHYYSIPIPRDLLEKLENQTIEMKVTLSYFIEPNPGRAANVDPQRYQSYGLRFDFQRPHETVPRFKQRVNPIERDDPKKRSQSEAVDPRWILGEDSISAGSVHCDVWKGPAIELSTRDTLCVKPINGWWRDRASLDICTRKARYALIITVKALADVDIYTPIRTGIGLPVPVEIEI